MRKTIIILLLCLTTAIANAGSVTIDLSKKAQNVEGWGVSLCWWARMCGTWDDDKIDEIIDWLVSPDGLNYNVFRYNIGGGDDPQNRNCELHHMGKGKGLRAEMPGFKVYPDDEYDWKADSAQTKIMLKIREKRPDAIFEAFSNSAPWYMTVSGCCGGLGDGKKDNLRPDCYEAFAQYLVDVCKHYKEAYGITFRTLEPFNESMSDFWKQSGSQEGCHFDAATQAIVTKHVYDKLREAKLETVISASDETSTGLALSAIDTYGDAIKMVRQWNVHTYHATNEERSELSKKVAEKGMTLWMSETGSGGKGIAGNLSLMQRLFDDMRYLKPITWCDWQYVEEKGDQWCLVNGNFATQEYRKVTSFYVRQQVTKFIKQGYSILDVDADNVLAAVSPSNDEIVVVVLNNSKDKFLTDITLPVNPKSIVTYTTSEREKLVQGKETVGKKTITVSMEPYSIKTYVIQTNGK